MKRLIMAAVAACGMIVGVEAAPAEVTQADLTAILERLNKLEAENKAQAKRIAELEGRASARSGAPAGAIVADKSTEVSESGRVYTTADGKKYFLADVSARIFEPLTESGLQFTPYGYLVFEGVYNTHDVDCDWSTDMVSKHGNHNSTLSMQDSILGMKFVTPESINGWKFSGKAEFDLAGGSQNDYDFHWRHLYVNAEHESGWQILFGQTWHLWKMVSPSEIDGAWMENTGHPYRRSPQIRVTKKWDLDEVSSLEMRLGIVKGGPGMGGDRDEDDIEDNTASAWALFEGAFIYDRVAAWEDTGRRWLIGLGGMYGRDRSHRWLGDDKDGDPIYGGSEDEYDSKMAMVAASIPFLDKFTLCGQFFAGENLGGVQAGCGQRVGYSEVGKKGQEVGTVGGFVDLAYQLNDDWSFAVGCGFDDPSDSEAKAARNTDGVLLNTRAYIDAFYQITSNFKIGVEYARLRTKYEDVGSCNDDRFQFSAFYDF